MSSVNIKKSFSVCFVWSFAKVDLKFVWFCLETWGNLIQIDFDFSRVLQVLSYCPLLKPDISNFSVVLWALQIDLPPNSGHVALHVEFLTSFHCDVTIDFSPKGRHHTRLQTFHYEYDVSTEWPVKKLRNRDVQTSAWGATCPDLLWWAI